MSESETQRARAIEIMRSPPPIDGKLAALDALDRLALNPSRWFSDNVINTLTDARIAVIGGRWTQAVRALEEARTSMVEFTKVLEASAAKDPSGKEAVKRAGEELNQVVLVLAWLDRQPQEERGPRER